MLILGEIEKKWQGKGYIFGKYGFLSILIITGTIFRFCYPFFSQPLDHFYSDPGRHYTNATSEFNQTINSWLDTPLPQVILRTALAIFSNTRPGTSTYLGLLCAITPWCWYLWGRQLFNSRKRALVFLAAITWLPSWIGIFGYFMDETLLLPALGITLWLSWKASKENTAMSFLLAILGWAFTLSIKLNSLLELIIVVPWLLFNFIKHNGRSLRSYGIAAAGVFILTATYLVYPWWVYQGLGSTWIYPAGMGVMTRAFYLSGAYSVSAQFILHGRTIAHMGPYECDSMQLKSFEPFSDWRTWRKGYYPLIVNCDKKLVFTPDMPHLSLPKRLLLITEGAVYFFFSRSWPDLREDDIIHIAQVEMRWIWSLLTIAVIGLAWQKKRFKDMVVVLCLGTALLYILCDGTTMTGRYRKPWEGIAIAAFVYLFNAPAKKRSDLINETT